MQPHTPHPPSSSPTPRATTAAATLGSNSARSFHQHQHHRQQPTSPSLHPTSLKTQPPPPIEPYQTFSSQNIFHAVNTLNSDDALEVAQKTFEAAANMQSSLPQCWVDPISSSSSSSSSTFSSNENSNNNNNNLLLPPSIASHCYATYSLPEGFLFEMRHRQKMMSEEEEDENYNNDVNNDVTAASSHHHRPLSDPLLLQVATNWNQEFQLILDKCYDDGVATDVSKDDDNNNSNNKKNDEKKTNSSEKQKRRREAGKLLDRLLEKFDEECESTIIPSFINLMFDPSALRVVSENNHQNENQQNFGGAAEGSTNNNNNTSEQGRFIKDPLMVKMQKLQEQQRKHLQEMETGHRQNPNQHHQELASMNSQPNTRRSFRSLGNFASFNLSQQVKDMTNNYNNLSVMMTGQQMVSSATLGQQYSNAQQQQHQKSQQSTQHSSSSPQSSSTDNIINKNFAESSTFAQNNFELHISLISSSTSPNAIQQIKREIECQRFFISMLLQTCFVRPLPITVAPMFLGSYKGHYVLVSAMPRKASSSHLTEATCPDFAAALAVVCRACNFTPYYFSSTSVSSSPSLFYGPSKASCRLATDGRLYVTSLIGLLPFLPPHSSSSSSFSSSASYLENGIMLNSRQTLAYIQYCAENDLIVEDQAMMTIMMNSSDKTNQQSIRGGVWSCGIYENGSVNEQNKQSLNGIKRSLQKFTSEKLLTKTASKPTLNILGLQLLFAASTSSSSMTKFIPNIMVEIMAQSLSIYFHSCRVSRDIAEKIILRNPAFNGSRAKLRIELGHHHHNSNNKKSATRANSVSLLNTNHHQTSNDPSAFNNLSFSSAQHLAVRLAENTLAFNDALNSSQQDDKNVRNDNNINNPNDLDEDDSSEINGTFYNANNDASSSSSSTGLLSSSLDLVAVVAALFCNEEGQHLLWSSPDSQDLPKIVEANFPGSMKAFSTILANNKFNNNNNNINPLSFIKQNGYAQQLLDRFAELIGIRFEEGVSAETGTQQFHFVTTQEGFSRVLRLASTNSNPMSDNISKFETLDEKLGANADILVGDYGYQWRYQKFLHEQNVQCEVKADPRQFETEVEEAQITLLDSATQQQGSTSSTSAALSTCLFEALHLCKYFIAKYTIASDEEHQTNNKNNSKVYETCIDILNRCLSLNNGTTTTTSSSYLAIQCRHEIAICFEKLTRFDEAVTEITKAVAEIGKLYHSHSTTSTSNSVASALALPILETAQRLHETMNVMELAEDDARTIYSIRSKLHHQTTIFQCKPFLAQLLFAEQKQQQQQHQLLRIPLTPHLAKGIAAGSLAMVLTSTSRQLEAEKLLQQELTSWEDIDENQDMIANLLRVDHNHHQDNIMSNNYSFGGGGGTAKHTNSFDVPAVGRTTSSVHGGIGGHSAASDDDNDDLHEERGAVASNTSFTSIQQQPQQQQQTSQSRVASFLVHHRQRGHQSVQGSRSCSTTQYPNMSENNNTGRRNNDDAEMTSGQFHFNHQHHVQNQNVSLEFILKSIHRTAFPPQTPVLGSLPLVLNNLACLQVSLKKYESAIRLYQREIKILEHYRKPSCEDEKKQLSQELHLVRLNLATALMHATQWSKSELLFALAQEAMEQEFGERSIQVGEVLLKKVMLHLARVKALTSSIKFNQEQQEIRQKQQKFLIVKDDKDILGNGDVQNARTVSENNEVKKNDDNNEAGNNHGKDGEKNENNNENNTNNNNSNNILLQIDNENEDIAIQQDKQQRSQLLSKIQEILEDAFDIFTTECVKSNGTACIEVSGLTVKQLIRRCCMLGMSGAKEDDDNKAVKAMWQQRQAEYK